MTDWKAVGRRVRRLRTHAKQTQDEVAAAIEYGRSTLGEVEGGTDQAGLALVLALADHFKVPLDWLLGRRVPPGGPLTTQLVNDLEELAWLMFWRELTPEERIHATKLLKVPNYNVVGE